MALIRTKVLVEVKVGDIVEAPETIYRSDLTLYVCHIEGDLLYISDEISAPKNECETSFAEDCYLV
jgi:hypothetical protein